MNAWRISLWIAIVLVIFGFLWMVRGVLAPFILAILIAALLEPFVRRLRKAKISRPIAVFIVLIGFFSLVAGVVLVAAPYIGGQYTQVRTNVQSIYEKVAASNPDEAMKSIDLTLEQNKGILKQFHLPTTRQEIVTKYVDPNRQLIQSKTQSFVTGGVVSILSVAGQLFMFLLVPVFVFGLLIDLESLKLGVARFIPPTIRSGTLSMFADIGEVFQNYLRGLVTTVVLYTLMMMTVLGVTGAPYFIVLALLAGLLYLIPVVGGVVSSIIVFLVIALSGQTSGSFIHAENSWIYAFSVVVVMFIFGFTYDSVVNPRIVGQAVKLNPVVSAFVVFSAAALFGLPGMLCAYPVAGAIKVILNRLVLFTGSTEGNIKLPAIPLRHRQLSEAN